MSQGNGAFGETISAAGTSGPQYCCKPIRSLPSAPSPCSRMTSRRGLPPDRGGRLGPVKGISIGGGSSKFVYLRGIADAGCCCHVWPQVQANVSHEAFRGMIGSVDG